MSTMLFVDTPIGRLGLIEEEGSLTHLLLPGNVAPDATMGYTPLLREAACQLGEYFAGVRTAFDLPMNPKGTDFQGAVWAALLTIPYGETRTYGQIAHQVDRPKAARAVGMANNKNPIPILIPCHRVVGAGGSLVGYAAGLEMKRVLLDLEGVT